MRGVGALLVGVLALGASCGCPPDPVTPGLYGGDHIAPLGITDYRLTVSADKSEVAERYVKDGKRYQVRYRRKAGGAN